MEGFVKQKVANVLLDFFYFTDNPIYAAVQSWSCPDLLCDSTYIGRMHLVEFAGMDASATHVVIIGGPETTDELLAIVLDDGEAIPLFDSVEEAETFLASIGDFGKDWRAQEVSAQRLVELLEYQDDEVEYVALSPPPERLEGGMEVQVIYREILTDLLRRQTAAQPTSERKGFWRRLFN